MAVVKYVSDKVVCLSTDTKPMDVADGADLYETDTLAHFLKVDGAWEEIISGGTVDRGDPAANDWTVGNFTTDGAWRDLDCSSIVPAGAKFIYFKVVIISNTTGLGFRLRKNGNANAVTTLSSVTNVAGKAMTIYGKVACDTDRFVEYMGDSGTFTTLNVVVMGWEL